MAEELLTGAATMQFVVADGSPQPSYNLSKHAKKREIT
jgi:hypothetical protein